VSETDREEYELSDQEHDEIRDLLCLDHDEHASAAEAADKSVAEVLRSPRLFVHLLSDIRRAGLIGESQNALILWIAATSRLREKPLSVLVKGSSSAGKNHLVNSVLQFFPAEKVHEISSMSERSLNFIDGSSLENSILYFYEIGGRNRSMHPNRILLSEGKLVHWYTRSVGGRRETRKEETGGPVACISTTTEDRLEVDDESRHLSIWIDESDTQTKRIAKAYSAENAEFLHPATLLAWKRLQRVIETRKGLVIRIPQWFQRIVDIALPIGDVRIRRYWPAFVEACKTVCLIRSFRWDDSELNEQGGLTFDFSDFAITTLVFDKAISESLCRNASEEEVRTKEMVTRIIENRGSSGGQMGVCAADLSYEPGVSSRDHAYRLLHRAERAGMVFRCNSPEKNNGKFYLPMLDSRFLGSPEYIFNSLNERMYAEFVHPFTDVRITFGQKKQ
jgi:hypothetical protein